MTEASDAAGGRKAPRAKARGKRTPSPKDVANGKGVTQKRYSAELRKKICKRLEAGESLHAISRVRGMPSYTSLHNWQKSKPEFAEAVAAAKAAAADYCMDQALKVAREATAASVTRDRLEVSAWEKRADKMGPGEAKAAKGAAEPVKVVFYIRRFEKLIGEDGKAYLREIKPEGQA